MHKITIIGHLGRDPEMKYTPDGQAVTTFSVASSRKYKTARLVSKGKKPNGSMSAPGANWG